MSRKKAKFIKYENKIQKKAGFGEIPEVAILRAENALLKNTVDFKEIATPMLSQLREAIKLAKESPEKINNLHQNLITPIMGLKANGAMFKYELVGALASIMLSFLEHIQELNKDALEIVEAHEKTLTLIISKTIKGDGGAMGKQVIEELESACSRYYRKNPDQFRPRS
jgi:hypothetical protein